MDILSNSGITGFIVGFGVTLLFALYQWRKGKKERRYDERYETVHIKAQTVSWCIMVVTILIMMIGSVIYEGPKLAFMLLAILYVIVLISYWIAVVINNKRT